MSLNLSKTLIFTLLFFSTALFADEKIPDKPVETSLQVFVYEDQPIFALSYKNAPHWHTYWINPGDAGLPTLIEAKNFKIEEMPWPVPTRYIEKGDILAYGYDGEYTRFFTAENIPSDGKLSLHSNWLVCKNICIPGKVDIEATYQGGVLSNNTANDFIVSPEVLTERLLELPQKTDFPETIDMVLKKGSEDLQLTLYYNYTNIGKKALRYNLGLLTPFRSKLLDISREKLYENGKGVFFGKFNIAWDGEYVEPPVAFPTNGEFEKPVTLKFLWQNPLTGSAQIIEKTFERFDPIGGDTIESLMASMTFLPPKSIYGDTSSESSAKGDPSQNSDQMTTPISTSLISILFFAFLGGLILNIMPCVLPVISLKLFGLVLHSDESHSSIFKHNLFYTLGVLSTFLTLALVILFLKSTGETVGWGFQLQSPIFVGIIILVLFVFSLNLFGLYEFATPGGKTLGNVELKKGFSGDFIGGILATILSTPCSAPFLGTALTFAFSASPFEIILTFQAIGLGLAFPFLLTGIFPGAIKLFPKPGMWMESVKKFLGLTLILTLIWLFDVFISLTLGNLPVLFLNTSLVFIFFGFYFQKYISKKKAWRIVFFLIPLFFVYKTLFYPYSTEASVGRTDLLKEKNLQGEILWEDWSEEKMAQYKTQGELVFIDFTAKWCFTCKVNEKLVLDTSGFRELVAERNVKLLLGDWTRYDPVIGAFLKKHGYVGVPAYFIQKPDGTLIKLGETVTLSKLRENLK